MRTDIEVEPKAERTIKPLTAGKPLKQKKMTTERLIEIVKEIEEYAVLFDEVKEIIEARQAEIKAYMTEENLEEMNLNNEYFVRFQPVARNTFNSTLFKKEQPDLYKDYLRVVNSMRFTITAA